MAAFRLLAGEPGYGFVGAPCPGRPGDADAQAFARTLGAEWAGPSDAAPPEPLDAASGFAPVGALLPEALRRSVPVRIHAQTYPLAAANAALDDLRAGRRQGAAVLVP